MVYKALLWTDVFWISYINRYKLYNNDLSVILGSKQGGSLKLVNPKHEDWKSVQLLTLSVLTFLFTLSMSSYFLTKTNKRKVRKWLKREKIFSRRFEMANAKYFPIFPEVFARIVKVTHLAQVINFRERAHEKTHLCKVDKNKRESTFFSLCFVFQYNSKTNCYCPFINATVKTNSLLSFHFSSFFLSIGSSPMHLQRAHIG